MNENKYDVLKLFFMRDYWVTDKICVTQPTLKQIIDFGETEFYDMVTLFCCNPTTMRLQLWHKGIDWNKVDDLQLFATLITAVPKEKTSLLIKDIDFTKFRLFTNDKDELEMVYMPDPSIIINDEIYKKLVGYLRLMFDYFPKVEKARNRATKELIITEEEQKLRIAKKESKNKKYTNTTLFPLISAYLNHPGAKYNSRELENIGIFEFMDSVKRLNVYENAVSLLSGMYCGMADLSKIDIKKETNWMRDMYE